MCGSFMCMRLDPSVSYFFLWEYASPVLCEDYIRYKAHDDLQNSRARGRKAYLEQ